MKEERDIKDLFPQYMQVREVADVLRCSTNYIYGLLSSGQLKGQKLGRVWRIPAENVKEYMQRPKEGK